MANEDLIKRIEERFRNSSSSGELFDTFQTAIESKISDADVYKVLLANPNLTKEEIMLFTEKLAVELPQFKYDFYMWTAQVFENNLFDINSLENSLNYYKKACLAKPVECDPVLRALGLYNYDLDLPLNSKVIETVEASAPGVNLKSRIYFALAEHFKKANNLDMEKIYLELAEKAARDEG